MHCCSHLLQQEDPSFAKKQDHDPSNTCIKYLLVVFLAPRTSINPFTFSQYTLGNRKKTGQTRLLKSIRRALGSPTNQ